MDENLKKLLMLLGIGGGLVLLSYYVVGGGAFFGLGENEASFFGLGAPKKRKLTKAAKKYVSKKIKKLQHEGYPNKQATAIAYDMARKAGYAVPAAPAA